jgi:hypothetical protein
VNRRKNLPQPTATAYFSRLTPESAADVAALVEVQAARPLVRPHVHAYQNGTCQVRGCGKVQP